MEKVKALVQEYQCKFDNLMTRHVIQSQYIMFALTFSHFTISRHAITTVAFLMANNLAASLPRPVFAPVIMITLSAAGVLIL